MMLFVLIIYYNNVIPINYILLYIIIYNNVIRINYIL
jgi:hypothetical protein